MCGDAAGVPELPWEHAAGGEEGATRAHTSAARAQATKEAMFGGCGYVPDIGSLQAWLECAWAAGFDTSGAEQLAHAVQVGEPSPHQAHGPAAWHAGLRVADLPLPTRRE